MLRSDIEDDLDYAYGDIEEDRIVAEGDREVCGNVRYGDPLRCFRQFMVSNQDANWRPNWPIN